jgi:hypothetical protein
MYEYGQGYKIERNYFFVMFTTVGWVESVEFLLHSRHTRVGLKFFHVSIFGNFFTKKDQKRRAAPIE